MDSSVLGALVAARNQLRMQDRGLRFRIATPQVRRILELSGLIDSFVIEESDAP